MIKVCSTQHLPPGRFSTPVCLHRSSCRFRNISKMYGVAVRRQGGIKFSPDHGLITHILSRGMNNVRWVTLQLLATAHGRDRPWPAFAPLCSSHALSLPLCRSCVPTSEVCTLLRRHRVRSTENNTSGAYAA